MSASFYDLLKYAKTGIAAPDMTAYDKMRALAAFGGRKTQTLTGQPPLSFKADGTPLISWSMKGNGSQSGTPTPDNPVMPEFVGELNENLAIIENTSYSLSNQYYKDTRLSGKLEAGTYTISFTTDSVSEGTPVNGTIGIGTEYRYTEDATWFRRKPVGDMTTIQITLLETACIWARLVRTGIQLTCSISISKIRVEEGSTAYGYKIPITCAGQTVPVYLGQVSTVRRVKKLVLTGDESFTKNNASATDYLYYAGRGTLLPSSISKTPVVCSHLQEFVSAPTGGNIGISTNNNFDAVYINFGAVVMNAQPSGNTVAGLKEYLAAQYAAGTPVTVWYVLAESQTAIVNEPLAKIGDYADELHSEDAGVTIPTAKGQNTLTVDTDLQPSEMTITYKG